MGIGTLTNPNFLIITTDEQRYPQHWPSAWVSNHLHSLTRLMNHGLTFTNAITAACECSPSRASYLTSTYPQVNGVETTPGVLPLSSQLANLATVLQTVEIPIPMFWKGKWHLSYSVNGHYNWNENDIATLAQNYGMLSWNPPDAGTSIGLGKELELSTIGGGVTNNDARYVGIYGPPPPNTWGTSAINFLSNWDPSHGQFCLVVSLVNPHDVFLYGGSSAKDMVSKAGYPSSAYQQGISTPPNMSDTLEQKPSVQLAFSKSFDPLPNPDDPSNYVNFYAYLHTQSDELIGELLRTLDEKGLTDNTLVIRYADHGEMGFSHNLREKMYVAYEEAIHVPLIFSNPQLWPSAQQCDELVSLIDIVPTIAAIAGANVPSTAVGTSILPLLEGQSQIPHPDGVVFTFDDVGFSSTLADSLGQIRCLRQTGWKYAVYFNETTPGQFQYELYDLTTDPYEMTNLAYPANVTPASCTQWNNMHNTLTNLLTEMNAMPSTWPTSPVCTQG